MDQTLAKVGPQSGLLKNVDDVFLCFKSWDHHLQSMEDMFKALANRGLTIKPSKANFGRSHVKYLGYVTSRDSS